MKKKSGLLVLVLLLAVGFAAVSTSLVINGTIGFNTNEEEFNVYFSDALVNNVQDLSVIENNQTITFKKEMKSLGETYTLDYDVTNGSKNYDAKLEMSCTESNDYLSITNEFDVSTNLSATKTRSGKLTIELIKSYAGDEAKEVSITCTIDATAQERDTLADGVAANPVKKIMKWIYTDLDNDGAISVGDIYTVNEESFNVISQNEDTVTMLATKVLGVNNIQNDSNIKKYKFISSESYINTDLDFPSIESDITSSINEYISYIQNLTGDKNITGNLITLDELKTLGCTSSTCVNSNNSSWLINGYYWFTRTVSSTENILWHVSSEGALCSCTGNNYPIRPVITISKSTLESM